ncbi:Replication-associated recombination protein A [Leclercia adecarboxylata]|nr:Replication-associated recombination protein A [Leclercia adecarboxylata]
MSNLSLDFSDNAFQPLAARMRPENLAQYIGQQHLLAAGKPLPRAIEAGHLHSMILWGHRVRVKQRWQRSLPVTPTPTSSVFRPSPQG